MPQVSLYNQEGSRVGEMELSEAMFGMKVRPTLVHEVVVALRANARRTIASTKTRGEVRGGGKKPWRQKGTGRARQGSTRSPQWVGGGIAFGPVAERNYTQKINKKLKKKALCMVLSDKVASQQMMVMEGVNTDLPKTKLITQVLKKLPIGASVLVVTPASDPRLSRMMRNLPWATYVTANTLSLVDVLNHKSLVFLKDAVPVLERRNR